jgi:UTP--glucose-1-phosphate uridylyltransferase
MVAENPVTKQLIDAAGKYASSAVGVQKVTPEAISKYSSIQAEKLEDRIYKVTDMNEKPKPCEAFSDMAILGRYVLTSKIFEVLENTPPGYGGEIQLTDGLRTLCKISPMVAVDFEGRRYDTGNLPGFLEATIDFALKDPSVGAWLKDFIIEKAKTF